MYLFKINILNSIKKFIQIISILFVLFFINTNIYAAEKYIGFFESLSGDVFKTSGGKKVKSNEFDQIFLNEEITISSNGNASISFLDNSILTLNKDSNFIVKNFDHLSQNPKFIIFFNKGSFTFESGTIAKNKKGTMKINLSEMEVSLNGTLVTGNNTDQEKRVALVEDSMGRVGSLSITIGDQTTSITEPSKGLTLSDNSEIQEFEISLEETSQIKRFIKDVAVDAQTETEDYINRAVAKQLAAGTIPDANGDGIADANDLDLYKEQLYEFKGIRMGYYMEMSNGNDFGLMSDMIRFSDSSQSMQLMQGMMEYDPANAEMMMKEVSKEGFDVFSHISNASNETGNMIYKGGPSNFEDVRASIVDGMMENQSEDSAGTMAMMMAVGDPTMNSYLVNEITNYGGVDPENNLSMNVLASFTEMAPNKMDAYMQADPSIMGNFTQSAFQNANEGDAGMIADMMQQSSGKNTAYLMSSMMENNDTMIASVYGNLAEQNFDIFNHIETAKMDLATPGNDPFFSTLGTDPLAPGTGPADMMATQNNFYNDLKGQIFNGIINSSDQTAAEATAGLMMNSQGDSAVFMMETMMDTNPEIIGDVMQGFVEDDFDIFDHFENTETDNLNDSADSVTTFADNDPDMQNFKVEVFKDMMTYSNDDTMGTMAMLVAGADAETASLIFETVVSEQNNIMNVDGGNLKSNFALDLMDNLSNVDPSIVDTMYENQGDLVDSMMSTAMSNVSANDSAAIANIISSSDNDSFNEAVFTGMASNNDSALTNNVFVSVADSSPETLIAMASTNTSLYKDMVSDVSDTGTTAASLMTDIYNTAGYTYTDPATGMTTTADTTTAATTTGTTAAGSNTGFEPTWSMTPSSGSYTKDDYISIYASAISSPPANGVTYSASGLPSGLNADYSSGYIFGTPTETGSFSVTLLAYDMQNSSYFSSVNFTLTISEESSGFGGGDTFDPSFTTWPSAYGAYSKNSPLYIYASAESSPITNGVSYSLENYPTGIFISESGEISGTPTMAGTYNVGVKATDKINPTYSKTVFFSLTITDDDGGGGGSVTWTTLAADFSTLTLTEGTPMSSINLSASGVGTITYSDDAFLPAGISLTAGVVSGTPTSSTAFSTSVTFTATDSNGNTEDLFVSFPAINASGGGGSVTWTTLATDFPSNLTESDPINSVTLNATGSGAISYTYSGTLPPGLILTANVLSGTPTTQSATSTNITFTATDSANKKQDLFVTLPAVSASSGGVVTWITSAADFSSLTLTQGSPMTSINLSATGGSGTISYADNAMLPAGISLVAGIVSGTPTSSTATSTSVTFTATDEDGDTEDLFVSFPAISASGGGANVSWNAAISGVPTTLTQNSTISSFDLSNSVNDEPATAIYSISSGSLPAGLDLFNSTVSGTPSTPGAATSVTFKVAESGSPTNIAFINVTFPVINASGGNPTITFSTPSGSLGTVSEGDPTNFTISASASNSETITYNFVTTNNINGITGIPSSMSLTSNVISGIAPTLLQAATYTFAVDASITGLTNNRSFTLDILAASSCVSPTNNICN